MRKKLVAGSSGLLIDDNAWPKLDCFNYTSSNDDIALNFGQLSLRNSCIALKQLPNGWPI